MRQMELELCQQDREQANATMVTVDRSTRQQVVVLIAQAMVAVIRSAQRQEADAGKEGDDESTV
jgi:hypothetical protein